MSKNEGLAEICTMITAFVDREVQAALNHAEYIHVIQSDDIADKAVAEERERIVAALYARKQTAAIGEERALKQDPPDWARAVKYQQEAAIFDEAIAIAREEG